MKNQNFFLNNTIILIENQNKYFQIRKLKNVAKR